MARAGAGRLHAPVHRPQPDARGRLRDRGPARDARRHRVPDPVLRRRRSTRSRPRPACARSGGGAARRGLRARAARRALRARRRLDGERRSRGRRSRPGRAGARATASCRREVTAGRGDDAALEAAPACATASATALELAGARRRRAWPARCAGAARAAARGVARADPRGGRRSCRGSRGSSRSSRARGSRSGLLVEERARAGAGRDVLPVRGPRLQRRGGQEPDRQRRPRADLARRPPGRARRRADGDPAERRSRWSRRSTGSGRSRC